MGNQSSSRLQGDHYQHLYSWYEALKLLDEESAYESMIVEHPTAGAADDVTLFPKSGYPEAARYVQVKWHTDYRSTYSSTQLVTSKVGEPSLLEKLFVSWRDLPRNHPIEIWLVSNWAADPNSLGSFLRGTHRLSDAFFNSGSRSTAGKIRQSWSGILHPADEKELEAFSRDLRFCLGLSQPLLEKMVDDGMRGHGLRTGRNAQDLAVAEVEDWIKAEPRPDRITRQLLYQAIQHRSLKAVRIEDPRVCLWVHGWRKNEFRTPATVERDWSRHFDYDEKALPSQEAWDQEILPDILAASKEVSLDSTEKLIDIRGLLPLTVSLAVGRAFPKALGYTLRAEQYSPATNQTELWRSDAIPSKLLLDSHSVSPGTWRRGSIDLLLVLGLTASPRALVEELCERDFFGPLRAAILATPAGDANQKFLQGDRDACALAIDTKDLLQRLRNQYQVHRIHLVPVSPAAFCLFLGQRPTALGKILTYERNKTGYQVSLTLETG